MMKIDPAALKLWAILDDIDTLADAIKPSDLVGYHEFFVRAMQKAGERHKVLYSDGYKLYQPDAIPRSKGVAPPPSQPMLRGHEYTPPSSKQCEWCRSPITKHRGKSKFCSDKCRRLRIKMRLLTNRQYKKDVPQ